MIRPWHDDENELPAIGSVEASIVALIFGIALFDLVLAAIGVVYLVQR